MKIEKINIEYYEKDGFSSSKCDKIRHIKTLPYLSVVQAVEGSYDISISNGEVYNTEAKGFFIAPSDVRQDIVHNVDKKTNNMVCRWVFLNIRINDLYNFDDLYDLPVILPKELAEEMSLLFDKLFASEDSFDEYVCYYEIVRLLSKIAIKKVNSDISGIEDALKYIKLNYKNKISVEDIANSVNLSASYLFSVFKKQTGVSPIVYLNNYRLSLAADMLIKTNKSITEISQTVGIFDSIYFNKLFKKSYHISPSAYREIFREKA